jgi:opacity protein-like surface antigen
MKFKIAALCLLASSCAIAEDKKVIAGLNYTKSLSAVATLTTDVTSGEVTEDLDISTLGLYLGYINENNNRFIVSYTSATIDFDKSNASEDATGFDLDWQFVYGEEQVQPYWGIGFGFHSIDDPLILRGTNLEGDTLSGASFQMMAGIKILVREQVELDISVQRKAYAWQSIDIDAGFASDTINTSYVQNALNVGAGFKF